MTNVMPLSSPALGKGQAWISKRRTEMQARSQDSRRDHVSFDPTRIVDDDCHA